MGESWGMLVINKPLWRHPVDFLNLPCCSDYHEDRPAGVIRLTRPRDTHCLTAKKQWPCVDAVLGIRASGSGRTRELGRTGRGERVCCGDFPWGKNQLAHRKEAHGPGGTGAV